MSHADKRSPVTDALETLGMIHFKPEAPSLAAPANTRA